jgi:hypothetical protein
VVTTPGRRKGAQDKRLVFLCPSCIELHGISGDDLIPLPDEGWKTCEWCSSRARFLADVNRTQRH